MNTNPLVARLEAAFRSVMGIPKFRSAVEVPEKMEMVRPSDRPDLGDFQSNIAFPLGKGMKKSPMEAAGEIAMEITPLLPFAEVSVVKPGFVNIRLSRGFVEEALNGIVNKPGLGLEKAKKRLKIVVDYGGPNVAKTLHVGHLRPAIIGEAMKNLARFLGHEAIGDVHLGDWGLPMGMLIAAVKEDGIDLSRLTADGLGALYPKASERAKTDAAFAARAAEETKKLQDGDAENRKIWQGFVAVSVEDIKKAYNILGVEFDLWLGESDAGASAGLLADRFAESGVSRASDGAEIIDIGEYPFKGSAPPPFMVRKSNGALVYGMTDLGTIYDRAGSMDPDLIFYHTDARQSLHFHQVFSVADKTGIMPRSKLEHLPHGNILDEGRRPLKTRDGGTLPLMELIGEAVGRAAAKSASAATARAVAVAAIKFADFINPREGDYVLNLDKFASFEGKTGPYVLYTAVRIKSLLGKARAERPYRIRLDNGYDAALAVHLCGFADAVEKSFEHRALNILTQYVYELCVRFGALYHNCKILAEPDAGLRDSWLALAKVSLDCIESWAGITKIEIPGEM
ncbi:MAG: arginine--tRNA ligase [Rickettsiales bacterium]|jgi:arginyl-tRNA synthetase|nr:arginine--tRNA ligase [Rickettsiales bacterium]